MEIIYILLCLVYIVSAYLISFIERNIKLLVEYEKKLNEELVNQFVSLSFSLDNAMLSRTSEILAALQEQHDRMLQSVMGTFLRLLFVGASTGGITSSASETHALSLLSVRLSAFAGIGMSHFFASSTSHCKYGDRAYGLA
jgi:hypothetical protein